MTDIKLGFFLPIWNPKNNPKSGFIEAFHNRKIMSIIFWDQKEALFVEFMKMRTIITANMYCQTLHHMQRLFRFYSEQKKMNAAFWNYFDS